MDTIFRVNCVLVFLFLLEAPLLESKWSNVSLVGEEGHLRFKSHSAKAFGPFPTVTAPIVSGTSLMLVPEALHPIILVPGYMNSQLEAKVSKLPNSFAWCKNKWDYFVIWYKLKNFKPYMIDCWASSFRLHYDPTHRRSFDTPGVKVRPVRFGQVGIVEHSLPGIKSVLGYFHKLVESLVGLGYVRDKNLMAAPYDWRKAPYENEEFIYFYRRLIETTYAINNKRPVILVCHGVGCTFTYYFLRIQPILWKAHFVKAMIAIAAPWGGSVQNMYSYLGNDDSFLVKTIPAIRLTERTFSSNAFQLPHPTLFGKEVLVETLLRNYTAFDYKDFFGGLGYPNAYDMWLDGNSVLAHLKHPEVDVFCINGIGFKTMEQIVYKKAIDISDENKHMKKFKRKIMYGNGDGVVNLKSLRRALLWQRDFRFKFHYHEFKAKHNDILKDVQPVSHVLNIVASLKYVL